MNEAEENRIRMQRSGHSSGKLLLLAGMLLFLVAFSINASLRAQQKQVATKAAVKRPRITEITIEHTGCFGACPVYKATLKQDGAVRYVGERYVKQIGAYTATVDADRFKRLAELAEILGYFKLQDRYAKPITDQEHILTSVVRNGKRKTIDNYGDAGPAALWGFEQLVDATINQVDDWKKIK